MKYEITEEQVMELVKGNAKVKKWFPEVFETKFNNGYYKHKGGRFEKWIVYADFENNKSYGIVTDGSWSTNVRLNYIKEHCELATDSEVLEALTNEFKKQNPNIRFNSYFYSSDSNSLIGWNNDIDNRIKLFNNGIWTKFHTKEEAEKLLNAKIV